MKFHLYNLAQIVDPEKRTYTVEQIALIVLFRSWIESKKHDHCARFELTYYLYKTI